MSRMTLEKLPNEILLEIFALLELTELHRSFSFLNERFEFLLRNNFLIYTARFLRSSTSFEQFYSKIGHLIFTDWNPQEIFPILQPSNFPRLTTLKISSTTSNYFGRISKELIERIFSFPTIERCRLDFPSTIYLDESPLPICSSLKSLTLSMITLDRLLHLLSCLPQLRYLNICFNSNGRTNFASEQTSNFNVEKIVLKLHNDILFNEILFLFSLLPKLRCFQIIGSVRDENFLRAILWKQMFNRLNNFTPLDRIRVHLEVRSSFHQTNYRQIFAGFREEIFREMNFKITTDRIHWVSIAARWSHDDQTEEKNIFSLPWSPDNL